ncbi:4Fe-4S dicluster domain-containing protein [Wukongibacter sp. M2B1]|uniref:4Fe-4S dicluster domain-containing protein n=1 Tax=Wukongibacter sp. M2B1 TaxID=3088895 RepID=UPI003D792F37
MKNKLLEAVKSAGIVGAGGAGFPTHVKLNAKAEYIIVNGAECEPLLRVDQQLMAFKTREILEALNRIVKETGAKRGIIALKGKYKKALDSLDRYIHQYESLDIFKLGNFYPAGDEQVTVYEVLKRIVPEGGIPLGVDVIVINVETLLNVYNALNGASVTEKYLTVTGAVRNPITAKVPIGITIAEAIDLADGSLVKDFQVIDGGPMMGKIIDDIDNPVTKTTKGLIVLPKEHPLLKSKYKSIGSMLKETRTACCHCSLCTEVCPRNLLGHKLHPDKIMRTASYGSTCDTNTSITEAFLCCECGLCEQACIMGLQPWKLNKLLKSQMSQNGIKNDNNRKPIEANQFREYRKFPVKKLVARLGLEKYDVEAPLKEEATKEFKTIKVNRRQHIGASTEPVIKVGDKVTKGQLILEVPDNKLGAKIHSSIDGWIEEIHEDYVVISKKI